jgi:transcription elongation factor Elf1
MNIAREHYCPVCGERIEHSRTYDETGALLEGSEFCARCGFSYEFTYGHTTEVIAGVEYGYSTYDDMGAAGKFLDETRLATAAARREMIRTGGAVAAEWLAMSNARPA